MIRVITIVLLAVFVVGAGGVCLACDGNHADGSSVPEHCLVHCACHTPALPLGAEASAPDTRAQPASFTDEPMPLSLFAASIFNPPKA